MSVGLGPVHDPAAVVDVDLHIDRPVRRAAVRDSGLLDAAENAVEVRFRDAEGVVVDGKGSVRIHEVER